MRGIAGTIVFMLLGTAGTASAIATEAPAEKGALTETTAVEKLGPEKIRKAYFDSYDLEAKERFIEAMGALQPVLEAFPNTYTVNYRSGWLAYRNKSWSESLKFYNKALAACPSSLEVHIGIIKVGAARQDWKAVSEQCRRAIQIDYDNSAANYWLVVAEAALGNRAAAMKNALRMLSLYPTATDFLVELGKLQYADGRYPQAAETFAGVQVLDPYNQSAAYYLNLLKTSAKQ